jgi:hypothetical protein
MPKQSITIAAKHQQLSLVCPCSEQTFLCLSLTRCARCHCRLFQMTVRCRCHTRCAQHKALIYQARSAQGELAPGRNAVSARRTSCLRYMGNEIMLVNVCGCSLTTICKSKQGAVAFSENTQWRQLLPEALSCSPSA